MVEIAPVPGNWVNFAAMNVACRKLVLALALVVMPLQGITATLSVLFCHGDAQAHATHASSAADHGTRHDSHSDDGGMSSSAADHSCCHNAASASPVVSLPAAVPIFPVRALAPTALHDLFFPEQPHRPPLA